MAEEENSVTYHYIKGNTFRVVHADGAVGGVTPSGGIHMGLFSERLAIPTAITQRLVPLAGPSANKGIPSMQLGEEVARVSRGGIVREVEVDAILSLDVAKRLRDWLTSHIETIEGSIE